MNELALFAGAGGGILGGYLLGWRTVCAVEHDAYARDVLVARQNDGCLPPFPIWDDVCTFNGHAWRGVVDVVSGGFPCQDISAAGKGAGIIGERSGLWAHMARIIGEVRPRYVFVENSPMLVSRGLDRVLSDLASLGFDAEWGVVGAGDAGAPHRRKRIWIVAQHPDRVYVGEVGGVRPGQRPDAGGVREDVADAKGQCGGTGPREARPEQDGDQFADGGDDGAVPHAASVRSCNDWTPRQSLRKQNHQTVGPPSRVRTDGRDSDWWSTEPGVGGMADGLASGVDLHGAHAAGDVGRVATGVPCRIDRLRCIGNGQVPLAAAMAWTILHGRLIDG